MRNQEKNKNYLGNVKVKFIFLDKSELLIENKPFFEAIQSAYEKITHKNEPLKVIFPTTKKMLYFEKNTIYSYLQKEIDQLELIEKLSCDGLFRNIDKITINEDYFIEKSSLWLKRGKEIFLLSDDEGISTIFSKELFQEV